MASHRAKARHRVPRTPPLNINPAIRALLPEMTGWRHALHAMPELGLQEVETAAKVAALCRGFGLTVTEGVGVTGVVATLQGQRAVKGGERGRSIGIRAELDALPMTEVLSLPYASTRPGVMHACGHDGHMAILLGAAKALAANADFAGQVHFIFQPAEEGLGGALAMLADGLFDRFPCDEIYALHNSGHPLGRVLVHHGVVAAAADRFVITITGQGGHAATPQDARNPLSAAARMLIALESLPARVTDARLPVVITIGALNGGDAFNVIPASAKLAGTVRALDMATRTRIEAEIRRQVTAIATAEGVTIEIDYASPFSVTRNTAPEADYVIAAATAIFGAGRVVIDPPPEMGSEDFGFMLEQRPGCYFQLGQGDADHRAYCHDVTYDFNDLALEPGASLWVRLVMDRLG